MELRELTTQDEWESFVVRSEPQTFLQSWEWGEAQKSAGEGVTCLGFFEHGAQIGAMLILTVHARRGRHYLIPHGPIARDEATAQRVITAAIGYLKDKARADQVVAIRIAPLLLHTKDNTLFLQTLRFRLAPMHVHAELTWVLDIIPDDEALLAAMRKTTRHAIQKAARVGVTTEVITDGTALERFWPLYEQTRQRHGFVPWSKKMIGRQIELFSKRDRIFAIMASYAGKDVAGAICIHFDRTVYYYHGASAKLPGSVPAAQLVQWRAIQEAKRRGATQYNFWGIAGSDQPKHPFAGITTFKKGFGGHEVDYLPAHDLPLSLGYATLWLTDTYRKWRRGF